jgi:spore coat protein H
MSRRSRQSLVLCGLACFLCLTTGCGRAAVGPPPARPVKPADVFQTTNIWTVQLRFTAAQWDAMQPAQAPRGLGGRGMLDPATFLAPVFLKQGDVNHDDHLSRDEFRALGEKWFAQWDTTKSGKLDADHLREGLATTFLTPGAGARGPGFNLQGKPGGRNGLAAAMGIEFQYVHADLDWGGQGFKDVAVRYKGNGTFVQSWDSLKRPLKIDLNK